MNQIRGFLLERGIAIRKGPSYLVTQLQVIFTEGDSSFSGRLLHLIRELKHEWDELERKIEEASAELARIAKKDGLDLSAWMAIVFVTVTVFLVGFRMVAIFSFPMMAGGAWFIARKHPKMFQLWGLSLSQKSYYDPRKH